MLTNSMFYTGFTAHQVKQGDGEFILQPYESKELHVFKILLIKILIS